MRRILALVASIFVLVSCVSGSGSESPPRTAASSPVPSIAPTAPPRPLPTATVPCIECWPLAGTPLAGGDQGKRPLVAKIDNSPDGRPHYGINRADLVIETIVEGFVTRLAVIYHSAEPSWFASVRSGRLPDRSITSMVRGALIYSGSNAFADDLFQRDARDGKYVNLSADHLASFYRFPERPGPYNMYTTPAAMRAEIARIDPRPVQVPRLEFIAADHPATEGGMGGALEATEIMIPFREDVSRVTYTWDAARRRYARAQNVAAKPVRTVDALDGQPVAAVNVVVLRTEIREVPQIVDAGGNRSFDMRLTGTGSATIFRDGLRQEATWNRPADRDPFVFKTTAGERILLAPGQTWIEVIPSDYVIESRYYR